MNDAFVTLKNSTNFDPVNYQYYDNLMNRRTIIFNEVVNEDIVELLICPLKAFEDDDSNEPVKIILCTEGGSVGDGLVLCNIIDNYKKPLEIHVMGYACSMGTVILCAGNNNPNVKKFCYPFTFALFHAGYTAVEGETLSVEDSMEFNRRVNDSIRDYVVKNTNITEEEYKLHERRQWFLSAKEMKEKGLIDVIIGEKDEAAN